MEQSCSTKPPLLHPRYPPYPRVFQPKGSSFSRSHTPGSYSQLQLPESYMTYASSSSISTTTTSSIVRRAAPGVRPPPEIIVTPSGSIVTTSSAPSSDSLMHHAPSVGGGGGYRRNDPSNRSYNMKKRAAAQVYHCQQCDKHIKYPSKITEHIRKHTGEKAHACTMCARSFSQAHTLKAHMVTHEHETPFKCSYCPMQFHHFVDKEVHEESHMEPQEDVHSARTTTTSTSTSTTTTTFIQIDPRRRRVVQEEEGGEEGEDDDAEDVRQGGVVDEEEAHQQQMCQIFECPEMCGFQSFNEHEVVAHIQMAQHGHHHLNEYETVCWTEEEQAKEDAEAVLVHQNYASPNDGDQLYEYFPEQQFVPQVESEAIIHHDETADHQSTVCTSNYYENDGRVGDGRIVYGDEEEVVDEEEDGEMQRGKVVIKQEEGGGAIYGNLHMIQHHLTNGEVIVRNNHHLDDVVGEGEVEDVVDDDEGGPTHMRVVVNPNPPKRGTKSLRDHHEATAAMTEMIVDAETYVMAQPRPLKYRVIPNDEAEAEKRAKKKKTMNVDWIIDAVAKGRDVNEASPHVRKKPTVHQCEYCGKVNKYPSKIRAHMRTHTGEKPFKCEICGMTFSQKTPMRLHLRRHLNQTPYPCEMDGCCERFVSASLLKQHIEKKHLMKKKFVCRTGCGRVFSSAYNLRHHEKKCVNVPTVYQESSRGGPGGVGGPPGEFEEDLDDEEDEEEMMEEDGVYMMGHMMEAEEPMIPEQHHHHFIEEPVFLHQ